MAVPAGFEHRARRTGADRLEVELFAKCVNEACANGGEVKLCSKSHVSTQSHKIVHWLKEHSACDAAYAALLTQIQTDTSALRDQLKCLNLLPCKELCKDVELRYISNTSCNIARGKSKVKAFFYDADSERERRCKPTHLEQKADDVWMILLRSSTRRTLC